MYLSLCGELCIPWHDTSRKNILNRNCHSKAEAEVSFQTSKVSFQTSKVSTFIWKEHQRYVWKKKTKTNKNETRKARFTIASQFCNTLNWNDEYEHKETGTKRS